jgi:hypothetical protein
MATQQTQAIQNVNTIISLAQQLLALSTSITSINNAWQDDGTANVINAMGTQALNTDGSLGAADGSPNNAHPMNLTTYPTLSRAISANQVASLLTVLNNIPVYVSGSSVSATAGVRGILNAATGG